MTAGEWDLPALRCLAAMPFLDRLELAAITGMSEGTAHYVLGRLRGAGLADSIRHAAPLTPSSRRWRLTAAGLGRLAMEEGTGVDRLLRTRPVSARWQRLLLARLDAVAVIYRLASAVAGAAGPPVFRWYRSAVLDAAMTLPGGKTLGVIRQGTTTDRTSFSHRVRWLPDPSRPLPRALLALVPDEARLGQARRLLNRYPGPVYLALEEHAANASAGDRVWRLTATPAVLSLGEALSHVRPGGRLPAEPPLTRLAPPQDLAIPEELEKVPDCLLPAALKPAEKRVLDRLSEWPWITHADLGGLMGLSPSGVSKLTSRLGRLGLVTSASLERRRRLALSRRGIALLARRDRASVGTAVKRWSAEPEDRSPLSSWREVPGSRSRPLARTMKHSQAVHNFMADLVRQAKGNSGYRVLQASPPHQSTRYFPHRGRLRSIHPDGSGVVRAYGKTYPFFLEWERRALNPSTMTARLGPYLRYYSTNRPLDDHGHRPLVLVVFDDFLAEGNFLGVARREMERARVNVPLWVSYRELLAKVGPLGRAWRSPEVLEPSQAVSIRP